MRYQFKGRVYDDTDMESLIHDICLYNSCYGPCPLLSPATNDCMASKYSATVVNGKDAAYVNSLKEQIIYHLICQDIIEVMEG